MRTVTPQTAAKLAQRLGTEPLLLVEVEWVDGSPMLYSDQDLAGAKSILVDLGGFDTSMTLQGAGDSQSVSVTLDDTDGSLRAIYNANDMHKRPARVYLLFKGLDVSHKVLLFKGELVTPIKWDETQRTMSFDILSKLTSLEAGFSMEEGDFPNIPEEALGKAWPLVFGQVCNMPAVQMRAPRRGYLLNGTGIADFTLDARLCQALRIQCPAVPTGSVEVVLQAGPAVLGYGQMDGTRSIDTIGPDLDCVQRRNEEVCKLIDLKNQQKVYEHGTLNIWNGVSFPQNTPVEIYIEGAKYKGTFTNNVFTVTNRQSPDYVTRTTPGSIDIPRCVEIQDFAYGATTRALFAFLVSYPVAGWYGTSDGTRGRLVGVTNEQLDQVREMFKKSVAADLKLVDPDTGENYTDISINPMSSWFANSDGISFKNSASNDDLYFQAEGDCNYTGVKAKGPTGGPADSWYFYDTMNASDFFWAPAGTEVYMESEAEVLWTVSLLPGTVDMVAAYKTGANGKRYLTEVPTDYYTVYYTDYDGYEVCEIGLNKALNLIDEDWDEQLYVSYTSEVGPNPCDIIEWLVEKYTDYTVDATSFATVKAYLTKYPANFYLLERMDVFELIQHVAYQSRCKVYVRNGVVYITYLSIEPSSVRTITESDILVESFNEYLSETEDVYTTHKITWRPSGAAVEEGLKVDRKVFLKYNVKKYGTVVLEEDYFCLNLYELVLKTATFWLIRKSNSWKMVEFKMPIRHLDLDIGDCITLNVAQFGSAVKAVIESMQYNPEDNTITVTCWTPIRSGENAEFYWAWPSQKPAARVWPLPGDPNGGAGYNFTVTPPLGHLLLGGYHVDDQVTLTNGDEHPSDLDDTLPTVRCEISDYVDFEQDDPVIEARKIAQQANRSQATAQTGGGAGGGGGQKNKRPTKKQDPKKDPTEKECCACGPGCNYKVILQFHKSAAQGHYLNLGASWPSKCGGPCYCDQSKSGCPSCYGPIWSVCHSFDDASQASRFAIAMRSHDMSKSRPSGDYEGGHTGYDGMWQCNEVRCVRATVSDGELAEGCDKSSDAEVGPGVGSETGTRTGETGDEPNYIDNPYVPGTQVPTVTPL